MTLRSLATRGHVSFGLMLPTADARGLLPVADMVALAQQAERGGFSALWTRDVPLIGPDYPDTGPFLDPVAWLGFLAGVTTSIALGTAGVVLPLRHPLHVAKAAASLQALSSGRLLLGLASGDRPDEYAAFGLDRAQAPQLYRDGFLTVRTALAEARAPGFELALTPRVDPPPPLLAIGSGGQTLQWLAAHADAWVSYPRELPAQRDMVRLWQRLVAERGGGVEKPFLQALGVDLADDPALPATPVPYGLRIGRNALVAHIAELRQIGVDHVLLNTTRGQRPSAEVVDELVREVLPQFR